MNEFEQYEPEKILTTILEIWHELYEVLGDDWDEFQKGLFDILKEGAYDKEDSEYAKEIFDYLQQHENALDYFNEAYDVRSGEFESATDIEIKSEAIPLYFGTDRERISNPVSIDQKFSGKRGDGTLRFGEAIVTVTPHKARFWHKIWRKEKVRRDTKLISVNILEINEFNKRANDLLNKADKREGLLFIHGFRVPFSDALQSAAQLAYDLDFPGIPLAFSWPANGTLKNYLSDEGAVIWSQELENFKTFLTHCFYELKLDKIHLVAHSMGNRLLTQTLKSLQKEKSTMQVGQVVFAAPDVDSEVFKLRAADFLTTATRYTMYTSDRDLAVALSYILHGGYPRAGILTQDNVVIASSVDTIDASSRRVTFLGHAYYAESQSIVSDIYQLFRQDKNPADRGLYSVDVDGSTMWEFA